MENTLKLPTLSARVYRELLRGLYAEPGFSDVTESDIAKKLGVTIRQVHGAVCKLIKSALVRFEDMQTCNGEEILYADIWRGDYDTAKALKAAHLAMLDEQLWYTEAADKAAAVASEQEANQRSTYGHTVAEIDADVASAAQNLGMDKKMYCMSLLSDVQEMMERGMLERARQTVNVVKRVLGTLKEVL